MLIHVVLKNTRLPHSLAKIKINNKKKIDLTFNISIILVDQTKTLFMKAVNFIYHCFGLFLLKFRIK